MSLRRTLTSGLLVVGALTVSGVSLVSAASVSTPALRPSDLPNGYKLTSHTTNNAQMAKTVGISKAQFDQHGRITGLQELFSNLKAPALLEVASNVFLYKTSAGAMWDWQKSSAYDRAHGKAATAPSIGDRSAGYIVTQKSGKVTYVSIGIDFQRGVYDMTAGVVGVQGKVSMNDVARYARIMVSRVP
jgi:hypothetical protein